MSAELPNLSKTNVTNRLEQLERRLEQAKEARVKKKCWTFLLTLLLGQLHWVPKAKSDTKRRKRSKCKIAIFLLFTCLGTDSSQSGTAKSTPKSYKTHGNWAIFLELSKPAWKLLICASANNWACSRVLKNFWNFNTSASRGMVLNTDMNAMTKRLREIGARYCW